MDLNETPHVVTPPGSEHPFLQSISVSVSGSTGSSIETFSDTNMTLVDFFHWENNDQEGAVTDDGSAFEEGFPIQDERTKIPPSVQSQQERERISRLAGLRAVKEILHARESRHNQRWAIDPTNHQRRIRLVAGCIPIFPNGKIMLISSQTETASDPVSHGSLGLPKGGWELDECIEEGAIRETYEEGGVLGLLGPPIESFCVPSGKTKTDRLLSKQQQNGDGNSSSPTKDQDDPHRTSHDVVQGSRVVSTNGITSTPVATDEIKSIRIDGTTTNDQHPDICRLTDFRQVSNIPTPSPFGDGISHTHTCMTFFPMYVQNVSNDWPEKTRKRYVVSIDEAIEMIKPKYRWMVEMIKENRWNLVPCT